FARRRRCRRKQLFRDRQLGECRQIPGRPDSGRQSFRLDLADRARAADLDAQSRRRCRPGHGLARILAAQLRCLCRRTRKADRRHQRRRSRSRPLMTAPVSDRGRKAARLGLGLLLLAMALVAIALLSLTTGARAIPAETVWGALTAYDPASTEHRTIQDLRLPRTIVGLLVGAALGLAGAVLQGATRNPLADPSILGINAGAALAVVLGVAFFGMTQLSTYVWLAFIGAGAAMLVVYAVASLGREGATPVKLALAGAAITAVLQSIINAILLTSPRTLDEVRFWQVGSLAGRSIDIVFQV